MPAQTSVQSVGLLIATVFSVVVIAAATRRQAAVGGRALIALMIAVAVWDAAGALVGAAVDLGGKLFWSKVQYLGICSASLLWLRFAFAYSQQEPRLSGRALVALSVVPVITFVLAATNEAHHLVWSNVSLVTDGLGVRAVFSYGPWFWVAATASYLYLFAGTVVMARSLVRFPPAYLPQTAAVLLGLAAPWLANAAYLAGLVPIPGLDVTPYAFTLSGLCFLYGLLRLRLLDLVPVAREALIERMDDGLLVLDTRQRIVDVNPAARGLLGLTGQTALIGQPVEQALEGWPGLPGVLGPGEPGTMLKEVQVGAVPPRFVDVRHSPLRNPGSRLTGTLVVLHDVTERVQQQRRREALLHAVRRLTAAVEPRDLLANLVTEATALVGGSFACVARWDASGERLHFVDGATVETTATDVVALGEGAFGRAAARRETVVVHAYDTDVAPDVERPLAGARAVVAAPLLHKNQLLGVVGVASRDAADAFGTVDAETLEVLASTGASALAGLEQARLEGVHLAAKTLQHELNNRLALTVGYAEMLERDSTMPEPLRPYATGVTESARDASQLVDRLLELSAVEETDWGPNGGTTIDLHLTDRKGD